MTRATRLLRPPFAQDAAPGTSACGGRDPAAASYGLEAAQALGVDAQRVFKALLAECAGRPVVAVVPVSRQLDVKALAAAMLPPAEAERATGCVVGGISPLGQRRRLPLVLDESALRYDTIHVSGVRRGLEIELAPQALIALVAGRAASIAHEQVVERRQPWRFSTRQAKTRSGAQSMTQCSNARCREPMVLRCTTPFVRAPHPRLAVVAPPMAESHAGIAGIRREPGRATARTRHPSLSSTIDLHPAR